MTAYVICEGSEKEYGSEDVVLKHLNAEGVRFGIDKENLHFRLKSAKHGDKVLAAQGKAPENGEDARLVYLVDFKDMVMEGENAIKRVDFKKIREFVEVEKDQELVAKLPASKGKAGRNVLGDAVYNPGKDIELPAGKNTYIAEDGLTLRAKISGYLSMTDKKMIVDNTLTIKGNVDFSTGNISYQGDVVIEGDVRSGFKVFATDDILIKGNVDAADIFSKNGNITVELGVLGKNKAKLLAGQNIVCGFVQDASVGAKNDIIIRRYAFNASLSAGQKILAVEEEGLIRGGTIVADESIEVISAGSLQNKVTELRISDSEYYEQDTQELEKKRSRNDLEAELSVARKRYDFLSLLGQRLGKLSAEKQSELDSVLEKISSLEAKIEKEKLTPAPEAEDSKDIEKEKYIIVRDRCYRGVNLQIGEAQTKIEEHLMALKITRRDDALVITSLDKGE